MQRPLISPLQRVRASVACLKHRSLTFLRIIYLSLACIFVIFNAYVILPILISTTQPLIIAVIETVGVVIAEIGIMLTIGWLVELVGGPVSRARMKEALEKILEDE